MKTKLDPKEKARRQAWRTAHYEARIQVEAAKKLRGETPLPTPTRKGRGLVLATLAGLVAAMPPEGTRIP